MTRNSYPLVSIANSITITENTAVHFTSMMSAYRRNERIKEICFSFANPDLNSLIESYQKHFIHRSPTWRLATANKIKCIQLYFIHILKLKFVVVKKTQNICMSFNFVPLPVRQIAMYGCCPTNIALRLKYVYFFCLKTDDYTYNAMVFKFI